MTLHDDEERTLARELAEEFDRQAISSGADAVLLETIETLAGEPKADSNLTKSERLHLIALFYEVRWFAKRRNPWLEDKMGDACQALVKRGVNERAAELMVQRVAEEHTINLINLADQAAALSGPERKAA